METLWKEKNLAGRDKREPGIAGKGGRDLDTADKDRRGRGIADRNKRAPGITDRNGREQGESLWVQKEYRLEGIPEDRRNGRGRAPLQGDVKADVAIIGAGLAGILTAYLLQEQGISVVVLESREAGSGITKNTTAKITAQHGTIYHNLIRFKGEERAGEYAAANRQAVELYEEIIGKLHIDCDFERLPSYIYSLRSEFPIRQEYMAAKRLGLPVEFTKETALPFPVKAAVKLNHQAQFHPLRFLDAIADRLTVYEHTVVTGIQNNGTVITERGRVRAKSVVVATHYPFINAPGYYFLKMHQERSYTAAIEDDDTLHSHRMDGMYLDADPQGFSFRNYRDYLIVGGFNHRTGDYKPIDAYARLEESIRQWYPKARIKYRWSNQDCMTPDSVPYIGRYSVSTPNIYVAAGFNMWGMSGSMTAAKTISDLIAGKADDHRKVFMPRRLMFSGSGTMLKDAGAVTGGFLCEYMKLPHDKLEDIRIGEAGVINHDGQRLGVYRENEAKYYFISTKCPHLGCSLEWNQNELTWDCPCHGSRFDYRGNLIGSPATRGASDACLRKRR